MLTIRVKMTRPKNAEYYSCQKNDIVDVPLEQYVHGVVASEIGDSPLEACKAQAVAARTNAMVCIDKGSAISDASSSAQAFRAERLNGYPIAKKAADETAGEVLTYNGAVCSPCSFSSDNGGRTTSSKARWGGERAWLIEQDDPWDKTTKKTGHGVGMSQAGAIQAAKLGFSYTDILSVYYPNTTLEKRGDQDMGKVKASWLIEKFQYMVDHHWKYVADAAREGAVDCSGAFTYWYKVAGSSMYHGSNTMYRKWSTEKGKIGSIKLVPGMAVYRWKEAKEGELPSAYLKDGLGNFKHVGLYIGNGKCIEAKGTQYGVVISDIKTWAYASKLINTEYDVTEGDAPMQKATVYAESGKTVNLRKTASTAGTILTHVPIGAEVLIGAETNGFTAVTYGQYFGYIMSKFLLIDKNSDSNSGSNSTPNKSSVTLVLDENVAKLLLIALKNAGITA